MGMLKFCITNRLATKFNWAGQNKKAFKTTKLKEVIYGNKSDVRFGYN